MVTRIEKLASWKNLLEHISDSFGSRDPGQSMLDWFECLGMNVFNAMVTTPLEYVVIDEDNDIGLFDTAENAKKHILVNAALVDEINSIWHNDKEIVWKLSIEFLE